MIFEEHIALSSVTTLKVGGPTKFLAQCASEEAVREALEEVKRQGLAHYVLGEGSNVLAPDAGYAGCILKIEIPGLTFEETESQTMVTAGAGVSWDTLVTEVAERGLWGVENLAGIPGFVGAAPVQNIGAYGVELESVLLYVDVIDTDTGEKKRLAKNECGLGYRDSRFKGEKNLIITSVALALSKDATPRIDYKDLAKAHDAGVDLSTPQAVGKAVRDIRSKKFPDRHIYGTAGSFFKNPILSKEHYGSLVTRYGTIPSFPNAKGVKIPLAFILDTILGLRGYRKGAAWLFDAQPLVLVVDAGGTAQEVEELARDVEKRVADATDITIEREVQSLSS